MAPLLLTLLLGCAVDDVARCEERSPGLERDRCFAERLAGIPAADLQTASETARLIADPLVRGEAVILWASAHNRELQPPAGQRELCALLGPLDEATCQRRLMTPHLQR